MKKPSDVKLTKVPKDTNMKDIYNKVKSDGGKKPEDDGILVVKVTGDADLNEVLGKIKSNSLMMFKPEEEKAIEKALREQPKKDTKAKPGQSKPVTKKDEEDENCPVYDYNKT